LVAGRDWPRQVAFRLPSLQHLVLTLMFLPCIVLLATVVDAVAKQYLPEFMKLDDVMKGISYWPWWLGVLIIGVGPGIGEELWCRAFLGRGLIARYGVGLGVLFSSMFFGLMHVEPRQVAYATVIGMFLHFVYLTTRSLLMPMLLHFLNNSLSVLAAAQEG